MIYLVRFQLWWGEILAKLKKVPKYFVKGFNDIAAVLPPLHYREKSVKGLIKIWDENWKTKALLDELMVFLLVGWRHYNLILKARENKKRSILIAIYFLQVFPFSILFVWDQFRSIL